MLVSKKIKTLLFLFALGASASMTSVLAQESKENDEEIVVLGTRTHSRSVQDSAVPIDIIGGEELATVGNGAGIVDNLQSLVPSLNATFAYDGSAFVRPVSVRGMAADQTLVMVNGKRRHRSALIQLFSPPNNRGSHAADMDMLPAIAIKNVEILRDGAAAQYGTDAIAGVFNFGLKDASDGGTVEASYGNHFEGEANWRLGANVGSRLCNDGFLNTSVEINDSEHLSRGEQHPAAQELIDKGVDGVGADSLNEDGYVQTWGRPKFEGRRASVNASCRLSGSSSAYVFGNYAKSVGLWSFFYRVPPQPGFEDRQNSVFNRTDGDNTNQFRDAAVNLDRELQAGFTPRLEADQNDFGVTAGVKGKNFMGMMGGRYDLSVSSGYNKIDYTLKNSLARNAPLDERGHAVRDFDTTDLEQKELNFNADFSQDWGENMVLSYGFESRREEYIQYVGSYPAYVGVGVSGMAGTKPEAAGSEDRRSYGAYADIEHLVSDSTFLQYALRFENYSDFGSTVTGKVAAFYELSPTLSLRGALSTGFRAPTPGQATLTSTVTDFRNRDDDPENEEIHIHHVPADSDRAKALGGTTLSEETAMNVSLGTVAALSKNLNLTVDLYRIQVDGRLYRNEVKGTEAGSDGVYRDISFYTNALDTTTMGADLILTNRIPQIDTTVSLAYNYNTIEVSGRKSIGGRPVVGDEVVEDIENYIPNHRFTLTSNTRFGDNLGLMARVRYFGSHFDEEGTIGGTRGENGVLTGVSHEIGSIYYLDLELSYQAMKNLKMVFGGANILNSYPDEIGDNPELASYRATGFNYAPSSLAGYDGGSWYLKGVYTF